MKFPSSLLRYYYWWIGDTCWCLWGLSSNVWMLWDFFAPKVLRASTWNPPFVCRIRRMIWKRGLAPRITGRTSGKTRYVCPTRAVLRVSGFGEFLPEGLRRVRYLRCDIHLGCDIRNTIWKANKIEEKMPPMGIEPTTPGLRDQCSTTELHRQSLCD